MEATYYEEVWVLQYTGKVANSKYIQEAEVKKQPFEKWSSIPNSEFSIIQRRIISDIQLFPWAEFGTTHDFYDQQTYDSQ